ncbi:unnamed protein product [Effrenium voratum]|nr:unnamed protein product [Effrenium voratum]
MASARAEQARLQRGNRGQPPLSPTSSFSPKAPGFGAGLGGYPDEISALREHAALTRLTHGGGSRESRRCFSKRPQLKSMREALLSPAEGGLWKDRYQTAQKENEVRGREIKELKLQMDVKDKEIKLLSQYVRKLEEEARIRDSQRERLLTDASISRSKFKQTEAEQQELVTRLHGLEDSFARCVGRVTQAATAGVVGVCLEEAQPVPRFAVLTRREPNGAVLEIFEEPDSHWELCAVELSPLGVGRKPPVGLDENALSLVTCGVAGGGVGSQEMVSCPAIKCPDRASFIKWSCAFRNLGLLPPYGAVAETPTSPKSPASPGARSEGASLATPALAQKDEALTETRLNSLLAAVEGNTSGEICWYQGHRVAGLFETSEQAVLCADEAQKEMALHNATRKGDFQLGMVCACDLGEVWRSTSVASPTAGPVLQRALGLAAAAGKVGDILATSELTAAKDWAKTAAHVEVSGEKAVVLDKDTVRFHTVSVQAAA